MVLPRHFVPPLVVNTLLGTVLWSSYSYSSTYLESVIPTHPIIVAASSGAIAGATQALAAAPAENVRLVLEGVEGAGPVKTLLGQAPNANASAGWTNAWKEVFRGRDPIIHAHSREEVRAIAQWVKEVRGVAGRGWDGWGWGVGKDSAGAVIRFFFRFLFHTRCCCFFNDFSDFFQALLSSFRSLNSPASSPMMHRAGWSASLNGGIFD